MIFMVFHIYEWLVFYDLHLWFQIYEWFMLHIPLVMTNNIAMENHHF